MQLRIGTSGYSYPAWKGHFYPKDLPAKKFLGFYAGKLDTVEINNTFYRMPTAKLVQSWADEVPDGFCFAIKAPQRITHFQRLKESADTVAALLRAIELLAEKQGPILFQLPPNFKKDVSLLKDFINGIPKRILAAFEFRHSSWFSDDTYEVLKSIDASLCIADDEKLSTPLIPTAKWGYLRLRREDYVEPDINEWGKRISAQNWERAFVYFKHEDNAKGPAFAALLRSMM
jgi:uncharacterized protein YecE (DUF72 family)